VASECTAASTSSRCTSAGPPAASPPQGFDVEKLWRG
jgi:hypothetical protein